MAAVQPEGDGPPPIDWRKPATGYPDDPAVPVDAKLHAGAVGDGVTDDTAVLMDALLKMRPGQTLQFGPGVYMITNLLLPSDKPVILAGPPPPEKPPPKPKKGAPAPTPASLAKEGRAVLQVIPRRRFRYPCSSAAGSSDHFVLSRAAEQGERRALRGVFAGP